LTAHSHRRSLLWKLNLHTTPKLMHFAIQHGFGSLPPPAKLVPGTDTVPAARVAR
jgi:hypothetical protein